MIYYPPTWGKTFVSSNKDSRNDRFYWMDNIYNMHNKLYLIQRNTDISKQSMPVNVEPLSKIERKSNEFILTTYTLTKINIIEATVYHYTSKENGMK